VSCAGAEFRPKQSLSAEGIGWQDVRAHLHGGVPKAEVRDKESMFAAYGVDVHSLFAERDADYYDFPEGWERTAERIPSLCEPAEERLREAFDEWWDAIQNASANSPTPGASWLPASNCSTPS
jgi:hypothetical protein